MSQKIKTSVEIDGSLSASQIPNAATDTDKFLVSDSGVVKYRTGSQILTDLGISPGTASHIEHPVKAGVAITKGQAVYVTSADGTNMVVGLASNSAEATSSKTMGLLDNTVSVNGFANVITEGLLAGLDTSTAIVGDPVWLGTNGNLIYGLANKPYAPSHLVFIGIVTRVNANNGEIFVKVQNGFELDELHDVDLHTTTPINGHLLGYNGTLWVNKTIAGWLGYTPADAARTISTTSPLSGGGDLSANRTLSIAQATAAASGYLSSIDWNTFNNKQNALGYTAANDANVVHLTGAETITGTKSFNSTTGIGIRSNNSGSGYGFYGDNSSTGIGAYVANSGQGKGFVVANVLNSFGNPFESIYNGVSNFSVSYLGNILGNSFIKNGGTSSQFLKADGSVDSNTYALNSGVVHTTGNESISGTKTFNVSTAISAIEIANTGGRALRINNSAGSLYGLLINNDTGVTTSPITIQKNGVNVFLINDAGIASNSNGILVSGTGTTNYIPKFTGANALGNSLIYDNGTNVGIGTTSPNNLLTLNSSGAAGNSTSIGLFSTFSQSTNRNWSIGLNLYAYGDFAIRTGSTLNGNPDTTRFLINPSGNVGIGTTSPSEKLEVQSGAASAKIKVSNSGGGYATLECSSNASSVAQLSFTNQLSLIGGNVGIGTTAPSQKLTIGDGIGTGNQYLRVNSSVTDIYIGQSGSGLFGLAANSAGNIGSDSTSYPFAIGTIQGQPLIFGTNNTERMRITSGGNFLIGTTSGTGKMRIDADGSVQDILQLRTLYASTGSRLISFMNSGGSEIGSVIQNTGSTVSYNVTSDYRLKEDLKPINGIDLISKINIYDYKWKGYNDRSYGVL
ncbi:tail fiber domain-containing protein, partial [Flavobacterium sp.]|uniref:tail fiber domain-containing protein n=1 Tax=Flavobacterium sp. TaxID=239 RepID=UPI0025F5C828